MNPVIWFEIYVQDLARAQRFYETVLDIKLTPLISPIPGMKMLTFPSMQTSTGASGALVQMEGVPSMPGGTLVYFSSQDCAVVQARIIGAGGVIHRPKTSIGEHGHIVLAYDTEGNMFGVHSM